MSADDGAAQAVSKCFVFKSQLQEYAQKAGLKTPVYNTIKDGPSHRPSFRSTVTVNDVKYDSLIGFLNRKAAEQSAAEVALKEISKSGATNERVSQHVLETGLCKNLLQEYAQKMNYAIPLYVSKKEEKQFRDSVYSCTVDVGGIKYIGGGAKTKKEAELKAARTALLAIQMSGPESGSSEKSNGGSVYTVVPTKRKEPDTAQETVKVRKEKKGRFKKPWKKRSRGESGDNLQAKETGVDDNAQEGATEFNHTDDVLGEVTAGLMANEGEAAVAISGSVPRDTSEGEDFLLLM